MASVRRAPGPKVHPVFNVLPARYRYRIGLARQYLRDPLDFFTRCAREYGGIVCLSPERVHLVSDPVYVKYVMQDNHPNYTKGKVYDILRTFFGNGLTTSEGEYWLRQRRLAQPAFSRRYSGNMLRLIVDSTAVMIRRWETSSGSGLPLDVRPGVTELTLDILLKTVLGGDWGDDPETLLKAVIVMENALDLFSSFGNPFRLPLWAPAPKNLRTKRALRTLEEHVHRMILSRRQGDGKGGDLLSLFIAARDPETGEGMSDRQLRDEVLTMFRAGNSTMRDGIVWTWYLIAKHPDSQERIRREVDAVLAGRAPSLEDLAALPYTHQVVQEAMRLYPPVSFMVRTALHDDEIGGYRIPSGSLIVISPWVTHRSPALWETAEEFDPDRFTPERSAGRPRFAYFPFGSGPRQCLGTNLTHLEMMALTSMMLQAFELEIDPGHSVSRKLLVTLTCDSLWLRLSSRSAIKARVGV